MMHWAILPLEREMINAAAEIERRLRNGETVPY
jgi:hypothetical protein